MKTHEKFLEFNGKNIIFININGSYWIALKPIWEALEVDYIRCFKNAKNDPILGAVLSEQTIQVEKNGKKQGRKVTCIPEEFIYGWIFSLRSESIELIDYKRTCYQLLFKHFHGTTTNRKDLLLERKSIDSRIYELKKSLQENDHIYKELKEIEIEKKKINKKLDIIDLKIIEQPELFPNN